MGDRPAERSVVVTGGANGIGRAVVERIVDDPAAAVVVLDVEGPRWIRDHAARGRLLVVEGDAADPAVAETAADRAEEMGRLTGWVNNAAVFRDADLATTPADEVVELIVANLALSVVGSGTAVRRFLRRGTAGAIVNVSSHQATRAVRGALPYATAKAALEGLTRAIAVDHGPAGIRCNAVALGSIVTERLRTHLDAPDAVVADGIRGDLARLHPLGRPGEVDEVASTVAFLLSNDAGYVTGAVVPVDGGRSALGLDPESRD